MKAACMYSELYKDGPSITTVVNEPNHPSKDVILDYMNNFDCCAVAPMNPVDLIDGKTHIGTVAAYTDGEYWWDTQGIYYFEKYNIPLDPAFIDHVLQQQ